MSSVTDSRPDEKGIFIWRRRKCFGCGRKFSTLECDADVLRGLKRIDVAKMEAMIADLSANLAVLREIDDG